MAHEKILIVDDEANFREIFSTKLGADGYLVETAINGEEGIKKAKEFGPSLILLDMKMPGIGGEEVFAKLREDPETAHIKVVFLTNLGDPSNAGVDDQLAKQFGADGYVKKTETLNNLSAIVAACLKEPPKNTA